MSLTTETIKPRRIDLVRQILTRNEGDLDRATVELVNAALSDKELHDDLLHGAARDLLVGAAREDREKAFNASKTPFSMGPGARAAQDRARGASGTVNVLLMDMPIPIDGVVKPMREWTGSELVGYADSEIGRAKTALRRATFVKLVGAEAGAKTVGSCMNEDRLRKLNEQAEKKVA